jgi:hypothetical protein
VKAYGLLAGFGASAPPATLPRRTFARRSLKPARNETVAKKYVGSSGERRCRGHEGSARQPDPDHPTGTGYWPDPWHNVYGQWTIHAERGRALDAPFAPLPDRPGLRVRATHTGRGEGSRRKPNRSAGTPRQVEKSVPKSGGSVTEGAVAGHGLPKLLDAKALQRELGVTRAAAEAIMRQVPIVAIEGLRKTYVRRDDVRRHLDRRTFAKDEVPA